MSRHAVQRLVSLAVLLLGAVWAVVHLRGSYVFYDEWSITSRILDHPAHELFLDSHNGHMWVLASFVYRLQLSGWGLQSHWFVNLVLVAALLAVHASLARVLRALSVAPLTAVLLAGALTYMGAAAQNMVFAVQFSLMLSMALGLLAVGTVLRAEPSVRSKTAVALMAVAAVLVENGGSLVTVPMLTVLVVGVWGRRSFSVVMPAWVVSGLWLVLAPSGPVYSASWTDSMQFAVRLLLASAGAVVGGAEWAGVVVVSLLLAACVVAYSQRWVASNGRWVTFGGLASAGTAVAAITRSRAGIPGFRDFVDFNRYLQCVAVPLVIAAIPAIIALWRRRPNVRMSVLGPIAAIGLFVAGIPALRSYDATFNGWNLATQHRVHDVAVVLRDGCPSGATPDLDSFPLGYLGPMVPATLLVELIDRGALEVPDDALLDPDPTGDVLTALCPTN